MQCKFEYYGIKQNYLSMIESKKREPSVEMLNMIYNAFYELTNGKIEILYTRE